MAGKMSAKSVENPDWRAIRTAGVPASSTEELCSSAYLFFGARFNADDPPAHHSLFYRLLSPSTISRAQPTQNLTPEEREKLIAKRTAIEQELESVAIIDRKVMVKMRDGKRMAADIYRPKDMSKKYPIIFSRTPYNFNYWDVRLGAPRDMTNELDAVKRGYVLIEMNERGHFFSEGNYEILGAPLTDVRRRVELDVRAAVVERQSGADRLLVDR